MDRVHAQDNSLTESSSESENTCREKPEATDRQQVPSDWSFIQDQEPPHIKEEHQELWISKEEERLHGLETDDVITFPLTCIPVKSEDEAKPQSSKLHQSQTWTAPGASSSSEHVKTESDREDCGGPQVDTQDETSDCSEIETDNSDDWKESRVPESGLNVLTGIEVSVSDKKPLSCSGTKTEPDHEDKTSDSSDSDKSFVWEDFRERRSASNCAHKSCNTSEKPFRCTECSKGFARKDNLHIHMRVHNGVKPFSCFKCGKSFGYKNCLDIHMTSHIKEKSFSCTKCEKTFKYEISMKRHVRLHTGEKLCQCSVCGKNFSEKSKLTVHKRRHAGEKPFSCPVWQKSFPCRGQFDTHLTVHPGLEQSCAGFVRKDTAKSGL